MDIQKELTKLDKDTQNLRNKYGKRFLRFYNACVNNKTANVRIINDANKANTIIDKDLEAASNALQSINYKY